MLTIAAPRSPFASATSSGRSRRLTRYAEESACSMPVRHVSQSPPSSSEVEGAAAFTSTLTPPASASRSARRAMTAGSEAPPTWHSTSAPASASPRVAASQAGPSMSSSAIAAPSAARRSAIARPMPEAPPVTTARRPASRPAIVPPPLAHAITSSPGGGESTRAPRGPVVGPGQGPEGRGRGGTRGCGATVGVVPSSHRGSPPAGDECAAAEGISIWRADWRYCSRGSAGERCCAAACWAASASPRRRSSAATMTTTTTARAARAAAAAGRPRRRPT